MTTTLRALVIMGLAFAGFALYAGEGDDKMNARVFELRRQWDALISGEIPYETWRTKSFDRQIIEDIALDAFEAAAADQSATAKDSRRQEDNRLRARNWMRQATLPV